MEPGSAGGSVSRWVADARRGDTQAADALWRRYYRRLVDYARRGLERPLGAVDEEDLAAHALQTCLFRLQRGALGAVANRHQFWNLLTTIVRRKRLNVTRDSRRRWLALHVDYRMLTAPDQIRADDLMSPAESAALREQFTRIVGLLDDELRIILRDRLIGYTVVEIAARLQRSVPTVERRLRMLRALCQEEGMPCPFG